MRESLLIALGGLACLAGVLHYGPRFLPAAFAAAAVIALAVEAVKYVREEGWKQAIELWLVIAGAVGFIASLVIALWRATH